MMDDDETLIRFHFGDLPPAEAEAMRERLECDSELAARYEELRHCLSAHGDPAECLHATPPAGESPCPPPASCLVDKTLRMVFGGGGKPTEKDLAPPPCRKRLSLADTVALGVAATLLVSIGLPALQSSREASRRLACEQSLGSIYQALALYGAEHRQRFPEIGRDENAGLFTVSLADGGYASRDELGRSMVCPSSDLARQVAAGEVRIEVPTRQRLVAATPEVIATLRRVMAGSLAYRIGYLDGDRYVYPTPPWACRSAVLGDAARLDATGRVALRNHGACGQNILFADGHVEFVGGCWTPGSDDHLFLNEAGQVAAGRCQADTVLAPSEATPSGVWFVKFGR